MEVDRAYKLRDAARRHEEARRELVDGDGSNPGGGHSSEHALIEAAAEYQLRADELAAVLDGPR